ncbi:MAG: hypothetical protein ACKVQC_03295 [Elusimicrobiota bacterium]
MPKYIFGLLLACNLAARAAEKTTPEKVPIVEIAEVPLRISPSDPLELKTKLSAGDEVWVLEKRGEWTKIKMASFVGKTGWLPDKALGYRSRFQKVNSWKAQTVEGGRGDYWFTMKINADGSFEHKHSPCIDCGEKPGCEDGERQINGSCISKGQLYRIGNFLWAKQPTRFQEYLLTDENNNLRSVYPVE